MDEIVRLADELRPGLTNLLAPAISQGVVQGAQLELDRYWYQANLVTQWTHGKPEVYLSQPDLGAWIHWKSTFLQPSLNWNFRPTDWADHCKAMGYIPDRPGTAEPIVIRVLRDPAEAKRLEGSQEPLKELPFRSLWLPLAFGNYALIYEMRPSAVAGAMFLFDRLRGALGLEKQPSVADLIIGRSEPNTAGTAGGYVRDPNSNRRFVVSCAHVLGPVGAETYRPGPFEGKQSTPVGIVRFSSVSPLIQSDQTCGIEVSPHAGRLDISISELYSEDFTRTGGPHQVRIISKIPPFLQVTYAGKVSGVVHAQINAITIWQQFFTPCFGDDPAGFRCYGRIFELAGLKGDIGSIAREGDSGAWVTDEIAGLTSWVGVIIGIQGARAYGCFAQPVLEATRNSPGFPNGLVL